MRLCELVSAKRLLGVNVSVRPFIRVPFFISKISAGFPSPAECAVEETLDLNQLLIDHPAATYFIRVEGDSMRDAGIFSGDILVVDRAAPVRCGSVVVAAVNGEFTVKRFIFKTRQPRLEAANPVYPDIFLSEEMDFQVWGVVCYAIHAVS